MRKRVEKRIRAIKHVCDCGSKNVDLTSVKEVPRLVNGKTFRMVEITYLCLDCGTSSKEEEFLYKLNREDEEAWKKSNLEE